MTCSKSASTNSRGWWIKAVIIVLSMDLFSNKKKIRADTLCWQYQWQQHGSEEKTRPRVWQQTELWAHPLDTEPCGSPEPRHGGHHHPARPPEHHGPGRIIACHQHIQIFTGEKNQWSQALFAWLLRHLRLKRSVEHRTLNRYLLSWNLFSRKLCGIH